MAQASDSRPFTDSELEKWAWDPTYLICLRELKVILVLFGLLMAWSIGLSTYMGYGAGEQKVGLIFGVPAWFVWGVAAPWAVGTVVSIIFALCYMQDHDLSDAEEEEKSPAEGRA